MMKLITITINGKPISVANTQRIDYATAIRLAGKEVQPGLTVTYRTDNSQGSLLPGILGICPDNTLIINVADTSNA